ncbi:hypothetical protein JWG45_17680 [Leptospira sp. 201903070]|uniref:Reverse transcriptase zinc-binding domain-containing protein n=1 Tax=Leptospira ainlahdjerensis TaxID=2810033 RepID=A0ABS2UF23_9LEPT|nr:hypothetical protein [Leptospira ainlahdjerensis]
MFLESSGVGDSLRKFWVGRPTPPRVYSFIWQLEPGQRRVSRVLQIEPNLLEVPTS